jgi:hypothetical protein
MEVLMRRKMMFLSIAAAFVLSVAGTVAFSASPGCNRCKKAGCPSGYCYIDCVGCCYNDPVRGTLCFR